MKKKAINGFTLVEVLIVVAILGLLVSIVMVSTKNSKDRADLVKRMQYSQSIKNAIGSDIRGEWNFDKGDLSDSTGSAPTGAINNLTIVNGGVNGGKALETPGTPSTYWFAPYNLNSPGPNSFNGDAISFEMWFYPYVLRDDLGASFFSYNEKFIFAYNPNPGVQSLYVVIRQEGSTTCSAFNYQPLSKFFDLNEWNHIAGSYSSKGIIKIVINGQTIISKTDCLSSKMEVVEDASAIMPGISGLIGKFDGIRIYNEVF